MLKSANPNLPRDPRDDPAGEAVPQPAAETRPPGAPAAPETAQLRDLSDSRADPAQANRPYAQTVRGQIQRVRLDLLARENERLDRQIQQLVEQQKEESDKDRVWRQQWEAQRESERKLLEQEQQRAEQESRKLEEERRLREAEQKRAELEHRKLEEERRLREAEHKRAELERQRLEEERRLREAEQKQHALELQRIEQERQAHEQERSQREALEAQLKQLGTQVDRLNSDLIRQAEEVAAAKSSPELRDTVKPLLMAVLEMLGDSDQASADAAAALIKAHGAGQGQTGTAGPAPQTGTAGPAPQTGTAGPAPQTGTAGPAPQTGTAGPAPTPSPDAAIALPPPGPGALGAAPARSPAPDPAGPAAKGPPPGATPARTGTPRPLAGGSFSAPAKPPLPPARRAGAPIWPRKAAASAPPKIDTDKLLGPRPMKPSAAAAYKPKDASLPEALDEDPFDDREKSSLDDEVAVEIARLLKPQDSEADAEALSLDPAPEAKSEPTPEAVPPVAPDQAAAPAPAHDSPLLLGTSETPALDPAQPSPAKAEALDTATSAETPALESRKTETDEADAPEAKTSDAKVFESKTPEAKTPEAKTAGANPSGSAADDAETTAAVPQRNPRPLPAEAMEKEPLPKCLTERWDDDDGSGTSGGSHPLDDLRRDKSSFRWPFRRLRATIEQDHAEVAKPKDTAGGAGKSPD